MAIKTTVQATIPAINLEYVQFDTLQMSISRAAPHKIALSAKTVLYGKDGEGMQIYDPSGAKDIVLSDVSAFIAGLSPGDQADAQAAMQKIQEGLGVLAEKYHGYTFVQYE